MGQLSFSKRQETINLSRDVSGEGESTDFMKTAGKKGVNRHRFTRHLPASLGNAVHTLQVTADY